eukprot:s333_g37.t1
MKCSAHWDLELADEVRQRPLRSGAGEEREDEAEAEAVFPSAKRLASVAGRRQAMGAVHLGKPESAAVPALGLAALSAWRAQAWVALPGSDELPRCRGLSHGASTGVRGVSTLGSQPQGARGVASAPGLGFCGSCFRLLSMALGARHLLRGVTALAAEKRVRRKRKAPIAKSEKKIREEKREKGVLARDLAGALKVSNEDIRQRREERRKRKQKEREMAEFEADPIYNITEGPDAIDPNIFGAPFVWAGLPSRGLPSDRGCQHVFKEKRATFPTTSLEDPWSFHYDLGLWN